MMQMNFLPVRLGLSAAALVGGLAMATHASAVVIKTTTPISIPQTIDGIYINLVTGATSLTPITGFDIDPYATATGLGFYFAGDATNGGVISGTAYVDLAVGAVVGPASTFSQSAQTAAAVNFQTAGTHVLGRALPERGNRCHQLRVPHLSDQWRRGLPGIVGDLVVRKLWRSHHGFQPGA